LFAAAILSSQKIIFVLIKNKNPAAIIPPNKGEIIQEATILPTLLQFTIEKPTPAIPAPITPPTIA
jgi:hypothetical protein